MELLDARRLPGPNVCSDSPGAILDIGCDHNDIPRLREIWERCINSAYDQLKWSKALLVFHVLPREGGVSLVFDAPIDHLYAASAINEWAWTCIESENRGESAPEFATALPEVEAALNDELNPELTSLQEAAVNHGITFLWDDDEVSLGMGEHAATWPIGSLPSETDLEWAKYANIPVGMITGTNGKTTCTRIASLILREAGHKVGVSCTDWLAVDDEIIDRDDWSGPGGARAILRQPNISAAILETARGGLLRRGLGVNQTDAALITNIAEDHLGDFGSGNLDELLSIKWVVSRAVKESGVLVLNADDARLVAKSKAHPGEISWFSLHPASEVVADAVSKGATVFLSDGNELYRQTKAGRESICKVDEIPITLGGAAKHNVANALGAAALTASMGIPLTTIGAALRHVSQEDNPGRCNIYENNGRRVLVDFAHNPHAMAALFDMARALPAKRRLLAFGQAGDRPDRSIRELTRAAWEIGLDAVYVSELPQYHRGRDYKEVFEVIQSELLAAGANAEQVRHFDLETDALDSALTWAEEGDLIIMLALGDRDAVRDMLV